MINSYLQKRSRYLNKLSENILNYLKNSPILFLNGPRQAGKSTLVQALRGKDFPAQYVTFDNATQMAAASTSPESFLKAHRGPLILDEVQMVPETFRALELVVDETRLQDKEHSNGQFLLTGSTNIMALPQLSEALVGRMAMKTLYPFSGYEVFDGEGDFLQQLFAGEFEEPTGDISLNDAIRCATCLIYRLMNCANVNPKFTAT